MHFVGVGGVGMSGLAQHLHRMGYSVSGSDRVISDRTQALEQLGIDLHIGHSATNVGNIELLVRTSAVPLDNAEVAEATRRGIPVVLREQLLGAIFNSFATRIAVCGTHGKTTVTAMIHAILRQANVSHAAFIGGVYQGNNYYFGRNIVVAEACEFNRSFLNLRPTVCVCLNAEYDHPDCYRSQNDVRKAFGQFMLNTSLDGVVVLPKELDYLCNKRNSINYDTQFKVDNVHLVEGKPHFDLFCTGCETLHLSVETVGAHNVNNAFAAIAVARYLNIPWADIQRALQAFCGVDRRWTEHNVGGLCKAVCDYAHHPTELACSVATAKSMAKGNVVCVFQPHTYSRTKAFWHQFVTCFSGADTIAYLPIYSAREKPIEGVTSQMLAEEALQLGYNACYLSDFASAVQWIKANTSPDDLLLILGAGNVCEIADML